MVLSSNDGCVISRSNEAKAIGVPMGAPVFKYRDLFRQHGIVQFSANFELYGDLSERITRLLTGITPRTEVYSVDESFLDLSELAISDYQAWGASVRQRILQEVGLPVSIGIASTKTLAKLASEHAKKDLSSGGVFDFITMAPQTLQQRLLQTPIKDLWGIGWRLAPKLKAEGVFTALDVARMRPRFAAQLMGVHGRQMVAELNNQSCLPLERFGKVRQTVMNGRMFGEDTSDFAVVESALASLTARAAFSLRKEGLVARNASVSLSTNRHKPGYQRKEYHLVLDTPTADTGTITAQLLRAVMDEFSASIEYHRANVLLYNLAGRDSIQPELFTATADAPPPSDRMKAFDAINSRFGSRTIHFAAENLSQAWQPKHQLRSPRYTTNWKELPIVRILE